MSSLRDAPRICLVGGAVRDQLLQLPVRERDWVVVGADPDWMLAQGYRAADPEFPVFLHPETGEEYALARTETKQATGYRGFVVDSSRAVTLEQDLARRDLTINAMARCADGELIDPFGGQQDLDEGLLRHVTPAFVEDPLRLLRVARFAARLGRWGFRVAHATHGLMKKMARADELEALPPQRVWRETRLAMAADQPWRYFEVLQRCGALALLMPELDRALGQSTGHQHRGLATPLRALERASKETHEPLQRLATLLLAALSPEQALIWCETWQAERALRELLVRMAGALAPLHHAADGTPDAWLTLLELGRADHVDGPLAGMVRVFGWLEPEQAQLLRQRMPAALEAWRSIRAADLAAQGHRGAMLGQLLRQQRFQALEQRLGSESSA